ncbi:MAG: hypothetical protein C0483_01175 [Pirellula sp.]|nr:hypothetical protein [Pirellula sp.]
MAATTLDAANDSPAYQRHGFVLARGLIASAAVEQARGELLRAASIIDPEIARESILDIDAAWQFLVKKDRSLGGLLYNAAKLLPAVQALASSQALIEGVRSIAGFRSPAIVDVNMRIDAPNEGKYLFSWHQDYWFSICSPRSLVAWIPLTDLDDETGGVEVLSLEQSQGRIYRVRAAENYHSYSDSIVLDEPLNASEAVRPVLSAGDVLFFRFDVLHRSRANLSQDRNRWTVQVRFADLEDPEFRRESFRPGVVTKDKITYLERLEREATHAV